MPQSDIEISCKSDNMVMGMNEEKDHSQITPTTYSFDPWDGEKSGTYLVCQKFQTSNLLISMLTILISCWKRNRGPESLGIYSTVRVSRMEQYASWSAIKPLGGKPISRNPCPVSAGWTNACGQPKLLSVFYNIVFSMEVSMFYSSWPLAGGIKTKANITAAAPDNWGILWLFYQPLHS